MDPTSTQDIILAIQANTYATQLIGNFLCVIISLLIAAYVGWSGEKTHS